MFGVRKWLVEARKKIEIFDGLQPFVLLGNIFGIFPCKLVNKRFISGGMMRRCYIFIIFGLRTYIGVLGASLILASTENSPAPLAILPTYLTQTVALIADYIITLFLEKRYVKFSDKLKLYDERVAKLGYSRKDRYRIYWVFVILTIFFGVEVARDELGSPKDRHVTWIGVALDFLYVLLHPVTYLLCILKFDLFVHLMHHRFRHLNVTVMPRVSWTRKLIPKCMNAVRFDDVMFLHSTLLDASKILTSTYSFVMTCWLSNQFFSTVLHIYFAKGTSLRSQLPYYVSTLIVVATTCAICTITADEANNAGKNMAKDEPTLIEDSTSMDRVRMQLYLLNNRVVFSASDLFVISLPLFYSMLVAIATYGILLSKMNTN